VPLPISPNMYLYLYIQFTVQITEDTRDSKTPTQTLQGKIID